MFAKGYVVYTKEGKQKKWNFVKECCCFDSNRATCDLLGVLIDMKLCNVKYYDKITRTPHYNGTVTITVYYHYTIDNITSRWKIEYVVIDNGILTIEEEGK